MSFCLFLAGVEVERKQARKGKQISLSSILSLFPSFLSQTPIHRKQGGTAAQEASRKKKQRRPLFACCAALPATLEERDSRSSPSLPSYLSPSNRSPFLDDLALEPFLYGCHYSTPGYCAFWLLRQHPQLALRLQGGRFDAPDRLFLSLKGAWDSATSAPTDVKELVPQFFWRDPSLYLCPAPPPGGGGGGGSAPSSLSRADSLSMNAPFGVRSDGRAVGDVELPPWAWRAAAEAESGAKARAASHPATSPSAAAAAAATADALSAALESDAVASALPFWIDLIFGFKSGRGSDNPEALRADNVFHPMTYGAVARAALAEVESKNESGETEASRRAARALRVQAAEFGRCPEALFSVPHPRVASFPRVKKKIGGALSPVREEEEGEGKKKSRSWAGALRLGRLRRGWGGGKKKEKPEEGREGAPAATEVVTASSPSFAEDQASAASASAAAAALAEAARLAAAAKLASHPLSDIEEFLEEDEEEEERGEKEKRKV